MRSVWTDTVQLPEYPALEGDITADVLVIGGGMAGVLCAYCLKEAGADVVLAEAGRIGQGITKNTTAKVTFQHGLIYSKLIGQWGVMQAQRYLHANQTALGHIRTLAQGMDCDWEDKSAFVYALTNREAIEQEVMAAQHLGIDARFVRQIPLPLPIAGAVEFPNQGQFHPLKFLAGLVPGMRIYENTMIERLEGTTAFARQGSIRAKHVIVATHFPFLKWRGLYFMKLYQHRSYVIALEGAPDVQGMYLEDVENGMSFRNHQGLLLIGGGDHRTGHTGGNWQVLRDFAKKAYPSAVERYAWAAQDCMTLDGAPYIGRYDGGDGEVYVATGFNKWGMTGAMAAAELLTDAILHTPNDAAAAFFPHRSMLRVQLLVNGAETLLRLATPKVPRCPHLGCALQWNAAERTWDCPCHGSRFEEGGHLIDNPATEGLKH